MVVPGLGDYFVYDHAWHPIMVHSLFYGSLFAAFASDRLQQENYGEYLRFTNQADIDKAYSDYKNMRNLPVVILYAAGAVYAYDIAFVYIKGKFNKKEHPYFGKKKNSQNTALFLTPTPRLEGMQLTYKLNF